MKENKKITDTLVKNKKPTVPEGFFDQFATDLLHKIAFESSILGQLKKREKPTLPEDYFSHQEIVSDQIKLDQLTQRKKPTVPANFFEDFEVNIAEQQKVDTKPSRVISVNFIRAFTAVAAALIAFVIAYNFNTNNEPIEQIATGETTENYDSYLAYLEEDDIVDFLIENEISFTADTAIISYDTYSLFSEEDIEDYYLEL